MKMRTNGSDESDEPDEDEVPSSSGSFASANRQKNFENRNKRRIAAYEEKYKNLGENENKNDQTFINVISLHELDFLFDKFTAPDIFSVPLKKVRVR